MKHRASTHISEAELERVEAAIKAAESRSAGEIVVFIVRSCHHYLWVYGLLGISGWLIASFVLIFQDLSWDWSRPFYLNFLIQLLGALTGVVLARFDFMRRWIVPAPWMHFHVHRQALANFFSAGLHETKDRTGVLIFISELEHRVEILADRGINEKVSPEFWESHIQELIEGIRHGRLASSLMRVIELIAVELEKHFPATAGDQNELSNKVRLTHHVFRA